MGAHDGEPAATRSREVRAQDRRLIQELSVVLLTSWDPIGIGNAPEAADEYAGYASPLLGRLMVGATEAEVSSWLGGVARDQLGLDPDSCFHQDAAVTVLAWWKQAQQAC